VLVVEDNPSTRLLLTYMLKNEYEVETACGFDEALRKTANRLFDALILDINLGEDRTGIDLLHALRKQPRYEEVPAVACTAFTAATHRMQIRAAGFTTFVGKPFTAEHILEAIARATRTTQPSAQGDPVASSDAASQSAAPDRPALYSTVKEYDVKGGFFKQRIA